MIGKCPIMEMKLSSDNSPEIVMRVILDCGANVPVISQAVVEKHRVPGVLRKQACGYSTFDGSESSDAGLLCACRLGAVDSTVMREYTQKG